MELISAAKKENCSVGKERAEPRARKKDEGGGKSKSDSPLVFLFLHLGSSVDLRGASDD